MSKRIKPKTFNTVDEYHTAVTAVANFEASLRELQAQRDLKIQELQRDFDVPIAAIEKEMETLTNSCAQFADAHRTELFGTAQSLAGPGARHGFRKGPPKLALLAKQTWEKVTAKLRSLHLNDYVRPKYETDKERIIADGKGGTIAIEENGAKMEFTLSEIGVRIAQTEEYFIEPKSEAAVTVKAKEAAA